MSVIIAVPTYETIAPETFKSIYGLSRPQHLVDKVGPILFDFCKGYGCARARNMLAKEALEYSADWVLFVDSDIVLPADTLIEMFRMLTDGGAMPQVQLGFYPRRNTTCGDSEIFSREHADFTDANNINYSTLDSLADLLEVKGGGLGCALVATDVFRKLDYPYFRYVEYDNGEVLSEDNYFCTKCTEAGIPVMANTRVRCGHLGRRVLYA